MSGASRQPGPLIALIYLVPMGLSNLHSLQYLNKVPAANLKDGPSYTLKYAIRVRNITESGEESRDRHLSRCKVFRAPIFKSPSIDKIESTIDIETDQE